MTILVFLKAAADLAFYYTFAGTAAVLLGGSPAILLASLGIQSLCVSASYAADRKACGIREKKGAAGGFPRFLPLALLILCFLLPGAGLAERVAAVPPAAYVLWLSARRLYQPDWSRQVDIFSLFWKLFLAFFAAVSFCGGFSAASAIAPPCALILLTASVLLMRSLRHQPSVYCQKRYQAMELTAVLLMSLCAWFLSTRWFRDACLGLLSAVYQRLVIPVLLVFAYGAGLLLQALVWLFSFIRLGFRAPEETVELDLTSAAELLQLEEEWTGGSPWLTRILTALGILAVLLLIFLLFRYLSQRQRPTFHPAAEGELRYSLDSPPAEKASPGESSAVQKVRSQYRKFLRLCRNRGASWKKSDTSQDVERLCRDLVDIDAEKQLRSLYLQARYHGQARKEDAEQARRLLASLKKTAGKHR